MYSGISWPSLGGTSHRSQNAFHLQGLHNDVSCTAGTHLKDSADTIGSAVADDAATRQATCCEANTCAQPTTAVSGYATLPTCETRTSGSIACSVLPECAAGYYGAPTLADVTCDADGGELSVSGCTECETVAHSTGDVTCTSATDSQVTACAAGYTLSESCGAADECIANECTGLPAEAAGYVLPSDCGSDASAFTTGSIVCSAPTCASGYWASSSPAVLTCDVDDGELSVSGCTECTLSTILLAS